MFFLVAFLLFSAAFFGVAYYVWIMPQQDAARMLDARLRSVRASTGSGKSTGATDLMRKVEGRGSFAFLGDFIAWLGLVRRLQVYITQANLTYRAADVAGSTLATALISYVIFDFFIPIFLLRLFAALLAGSAPIAWIVRKRTARMGKFEEQLPDAIDLFTRTMRAGHNIHSGLETIAAETSDPVRMEFRKMMEELALGSQIEPALHNLGERVPLIDLKFFITGLILQRQTGANMVAVLENLSVLVRERLNMAAKLKAHTAQQRFSAGLLCALPFVVGLGFEVLKPEYIRLLWTDPVGVKFFTYAIISECVGILVIRRMANIKF
jgi:tight adherence protein B